MDFSSSKPHVFLLLFDSQRRVLPFAPYFPPSAYSDSLSPPRVLSSLPICGNPAHFLSPALPSHTLSWCRSSLFVLLSHWWPFKYLTMKYSYFILSYSCLEENKTLKIFSLTLNFCSSILCEWYRFNFAS